MISVMATLVDMAPAPGSLSSLVRDGLEAVVEVMDGALASDRAEVETLVAHAGRYRGKMFRPALAVVAAAAGAGERFSTESGRFREVVTLGAVVETIHLATLVHDDVLDEAETRRGSVSVNGLVGNEAAVILGDYLFARSFQLCSTLPVRDGAGRHTATMVGEVTSRVCSGELSQLVNRRNAELGVEQYFRIIGDKTASLIAAACELGAMHAGASERAVRALHDYGMGIGTAFQIRDDLLDLVGDDDEVGKPLGRDFELGKLTLPLIHHLAAVNGAADDLRDALRRGKRLDGAARATLAGVLRETGSIEHAEAVAERHVEGAVRALDVLEETPACGYLRDLAGAVLVRSA